MLVVRDLETHFFGEEGVVRAVNGVSFSVAPGEVVAIVGESGSGKSVTALSILGLVAEPGRVVGGSIELGGEDLTRATERRLREVRGDRVSMIFQDPMTALNPYLTIGEQLAEVLVTHRRAARAEARRASIEMLGKVGIAAPEERFSAYPHHLSGGMRQRVMIAMALLCGPQLLVADEPTTALDVTIQAQILDLLREQRAQTGAGILLITHDLGVVASLADRVLVMYAGRVVEEASVDALFQDPRHPYTIGLLGSIPRLDDAGKDLYAIPGHLPAGARLPSGCPFHPRCGEAIARCSTEMPAGRTIGAGHQARCHVETVRLRRTA